LPFIFLTSEKFVRFTAITLWIFIVVCLKIKVDYMISGIKNSIIIGLALLVCSSCSLLVGSSDNDLKSETMRINYLSSNWQPITPDSADYAVQNPVSGSVITANSMCKKYDSTSLKHLTINILSGVESPIELSSITLQFNAREALQTAIKGKLDGVLTFMDILTVRKNRCVYDFILISPNRKTFERDQRDFKQFLSDVDID